MKYFQSYASFRGLDFYSDSATFLCQAVFIEISVNNASDQKDMQLSLFSLHKKYLS
jgi:hypothetical protein